MLAGATFANLARPALLNRQEFDVIEITGPVRVEQLLDALGDLLFALELICIEFAGQFAERLLHALQTLSTGLSVALSLFTGVDPVHGVVGFSSRIVSGETIECLILGCAVGNELAQDPFFCLVGRFKRLLERFDLAPGLGQQGDDPSTMAGDEGELPVRADLAVGHIEKIWPAGNRQDLLPRLDMRGVVGTVARIGLELNRHGTVGREG